MASRHNAHWARLALALVGAGAACLLASASAGAQAAQDPQALAWIKQGLALLNGGSTVSDVTIQVSVIYTAGSDNETGTGTLQALGDTYGLVALNLTDGRRQNIRGDGTGAWIGSDGSVKSYAPQNCWTDAAWFFPGLVLASIPLNPQVVLVNLGPALWKGLSVKHVRIYKLVSGRDPATTAAIRDDSTEDVYLEAASGLPLAVAFKTYSDDGAPGSVRNEIQYSDYRAMDGITVPFHIERYLNGSLLLDMTVTDVAINSGLSPNLFNVPKVPASGLVGNPDSR